MVLAPPASCATVTFRVASEAVASVTLCCSEADPICVPVVVSVKVTVPVGANPYGFPVTVTRSVEVLGLPASMVLLAVIATAGTAAVTVMEMPVEVLGA
jgi:hypothetical protein